MSRRECTHIPNKLVDSIEEGLVSQGEVVFSESLNLDFSNVIRCT